MRGCTRRRNADFVADYDQQCDDELSDLLSRSTSPATLADIHRFIAWSKRHAQGQLQDELTDDLIREHVRIALGNGQTEDDAGDEDFARLVDFVQKTLIDHHVSCYIVLPRAG